jgi:hypothetical protein
MMERKMDTQTDNPSFHEFKDYWQWSDEMINDASKKELAEAARILAMQAAHYARKYGELELPDIAQLLAAPTLDEESVGLLRDGTAALVGVLATVKGFSEAAFDRTD